MNSLAYLSKQYDVLASTPPSTPTKEHADFKLRGRDAQPGRAKRTRSWARDNLLSIGSSSSKEAAKRSRSTPALVALASKPQLQKPPPPLPPLPSPEPGLTSPAEELARWGLTRWRRTWVVRTWILLWDALAHAYRLMVRARIAAPPILAEPVSASTSASGGESTAESDEDDILVTRARPRKTTSAPVVPQTEDTDPPTPDLPTVTLSLPTPEKIAPPPGLLQAPLANYLLSYSPPPSLPSTQPGTPPPSRRSHLHLPKTLVLDLDETLIHSTSRPLHAGAGGGGGLLGLGWGRRGKPGGHMVEVVLGGRSTLYHVYKRPFVDYFLRKVSGWYTLVIFTASMQEYADPVIDWLDGGRGILARRLFRESCTQLPSGSYSKDLSVVEPDLARVCLLDNSPASYSINQTNGIPIEGWTHDQSDEALLDLLPFLDSLRFTSDVRRVLGIRGFQ